MSELARELQNVSGSDLGAVTLRRLMLERALGEFQERRLVDEGYEVISRSEEVEQLQERNVTDLLAEMLGDIGRCEHHIYKPTTSEARRLYCIAVATAHLRDLIWATQRAHERERDLARERERRLRGRARELERRLECQTQ